MIFQIVTWNDNLREVLRCFSQLSKVAAGEGAAPAFSYPD